MPSTRRRLSRQEKQAQTRVRLLRSAELVFAERGFFAASLDEIAARAGFSIGAVYSNFESKGDLFLALFEEHVAGQVRDYLELFAAGETLDEQARGGAELEVIAHLASDVLLEQRQEQIPLALEVRVDGADREPRARGDLIQRRSEETTFGKYQLGRSQQPYARLRLLLLPRQPATSNGHN